MYAYDRKICGWTGNRTRDHCLNSYWATQDDIPGPTTILSPHLSRTSPHFLLWSNDQGQKSVSIKDKGQMYAYERKRGTFVAGPGIEPGTPVLLDTKPPNPNNNSLSRTSSHFLLRSNNQGQKLPVKYLFLSKIKARCKLMKGGEGICGWTGNQTRGLLYY